MKKGIAVAVSMLLAGQCFADPMLGAVIPSDTLAGHSEVSLSFQTEPVKPAISYDVTGYTIFGVIYVAGAVAKMKANSSTLQKSYDDLLAAHADIHSLRDTFTQELSKDLQADGLALTEVPEVKKKGDSKAVAYPVTASDLKTKALLVFDGLATGYHASGSTDPYFARAGVTVSVLNQANLAAAPVQYRPIVICEDEKLDSAHIYHGFDDVIKDPQNSYEGLQQCMRRLAQQIADRFAHAPAAAATPMSGMAQPPALIASPVTTLN